MLESWRMIKSYGEFVIRKNPEDPSEYAFCLLSSEQALILPRGGLEEIAKSDRTNAITKIQNVDGSFYSQLPIQEIGIDYVLAAIKHAYIFEQERINREIEEHPYIEKNLLI